MVKATKRFCLQCDDGTELEHTARDVVIRYQSHCGSVPGILGWHCPKCGEIEFDAGEGTRYQEALTQLREKAQYDHECLSELAKSMSPFCKTTTD